MCKFTRRGGRICRVRASRSLVFSRIKLLIYKYKILCSTKFTHYLKTDKNPELFLFAPHRLSQLDVTNGKASSMSVDPNLIHKALFKTQSREDGPVRPVTFTVKI